ncbi:MAG: hypothetical protein KQH57_01545 [Actinomycetales bacterium]|nr:hypothetical protein [Actinomycetales bacterium]
MTSKLQLREQFSACGAPLRVDVYGSQPREHVLDDLTFLNYRLAEVVISPEITVDTPDIVWQMDGEKGVSYDGHTMTFTGDWPAGPLQKAIVTMLTLRMEEIGLHPFHSAAVNYRGKTVLVLGGESNHGKSMALIEAGVRGGVQVASETSVIDEQGVVVKGSVEPFLIKRTEGTERADKAAPNKGVEKFWGAMPTWEITDQPAEIDVVLVPAIDGNFDPSTTELIPFEKQFQSLHSLQNYLLTNELLAPGHPMPVVDTDERRQARADFLQSFCTRPFFFIRAATPQVLLDEFDKTYDA